MSIKVSVVDDDERTRISLKFMLASLPVVKLVGIYGSAAEVIDAVPYSPVNLVFMDEVMPGLTGLACLRPLMAIQTGLKVVILNGIIDLGIIQAVQEFGGAGIMAKPKLSSELAIAIHSVLAGKFFVSEPFISMNQETCPPFEYSVAFPSFLTPTAFQKWDASEANPRFWLDLAYKSEYQPETFARLWGSSERQARREFKTCFGLPLHEWLNRVQMAWVKHYLLKGLHPKEILNPVHIDSLPSLCRKFKRHFHQTMSEFRHNAGVSAANHGRND